jgi:hypothetical protein
VTVGGLLAIVRLEAIEAEAVAIVSGARGMILV